MDCNKTELYSSECASERFTGDPDYIQTERQEPTFGTLNPFAVSGLHFDKWVLYDDKQHKIYAAFDNVDAMKEFLTDKQFPYFWEYVRDNQRKVSLSSRVPSIYCEGTELRVKQCSKLDNNEDVVYPTKWCVYHEQECDNVAKLRELEQLMVDKLGELIERRADDDISKYPF
jgi:hypothetical protein